MKIVVTSKKPVHTAECGTLPVDMPVEVSDALGKFLIERGDATPFETKSESTEHVETKAKKK